MKISVIAAIVVVIVPALAAAQSGAPPEEVLSLDAAVRLALDNSRPLQNAKLEVAKAEEDLSAVRTRRLPTFETSMFASQLLSPVEFQFPRGAFGEYPGVGPIPAIDTSVATPREPNAYVTAMVSQPLSQLKQIGTRVKAAAVGRDIQHERLRAEQLSVINAVKRIYFAILQTRSALVASDDVLALYRELERTLKVRVAERVALRPEALDIEARLADEQVAQITWRNALAGQKEQLNQLIGRDVRTRFDVQDVAELSLLEVDLMAAQSRALDSRPDVQEARLAVQHAELDRQLAQADAIPEISLAFSYSSYFNIDMMPRNLAAVGVQVKWEPFDWGRRGHEIAAKRHGIEQARRALREVEDRALIEINTRYRKLEETRARLNAARIGQQAAREKLRVRTSQYQVQAALLSDVLQLRADLSSSTDRYQQALLAFWTAKADFDHAVAQE